MGKENRKRVKKAMIFEPLEDYVVIKRIDPEEVSPGGIVIPQTARQKPIEGEVVAVGPGRILESGNRALMSLKAGDRVVFSSYAGVEVNDDGEEYLVLKERDILTKVLRD